MHAAITLIESTDKDTIHLAVPAIQSILSKAGTSSTIEPLADAMDGARDERLLIYLFVLGNKPRVLHPVLVRALRSRSPHTRSQTSSVLAALLADQERPADIRTAATGQRLGMLRDGPDFQIRRATRWASLITAYVQHRDKFLPRGYPSCQGCVVAPGPS